MKNKSDLNTFFRENGRKLRVDPSPHAWGKLEKKLDDRNRGNRIFNLGWLSAAAAILVIVVSIYVWNSYDDSITTDAGFSPVFVEELNSGDDCAPYCMLVHNRDKLPAYYSVPVREKVN